MEYKIVNYIQKRITISLKEQKERLFSGHVNILVKDQLPENIDLDHVLKTIEKKIPSHLFYNLDSVIVAHLDVFDERSINAMYADGALYITNLQDNNKDMIDDIVHELSHSVEELDPLHIYGDQALEIEFLSKRMSLFGALRNAGYDTEPEYFHNVEYDKYFDMYLYKEIGYDRLEILSTSIFSRPYAATSLREYFATGFEEFYLGNRNFLKDISPILYLKLVQLHKGENKDES